MIRMNVSLMEYMCLEYDNLCSKIQVSETDPDQSWNVINVVLEYTTLHFPRHKHSFCFLTVL
jgi:hypothetical protein